MALKRSIAAALAVSTVWAPASLAREKDPLDVLRACRKIEEPMKRLACYDSALTDAETTQKVNREERVRRQKEEFGLTPLQVENRREQEKEQTEAPTTDTVGNPAQQEDEAAQRQRLSSTIGEILTDAAGHKVFMLTNGQIWRETAGSHYRGILRPGWKVEINKTALGGYKMTIEDRTGYFAVQRMR
ncbi:hypothetical protein [Stakelama marina]|uniref:Uncharacterized protein n=1 Tax=Stakelama marina TaxID=2826939 RepID=A0A8T4INX0_9SPHN|nr:hypothetical protein [Stakelama marina]MBR0554039.1 hypothetical protein [Stakelama marina]